MPTRDETFRKFGPILTEAIMLILLEQINELRINQGMAEVTEQDLIISLDNHINSLLPYDWMDH